MSQVAAFVVRAASAARAEKVEPRPAALGHARGMGTWAAGPFGNDTALDFVGDVIDQLMGAILEFMESPEIDETFDAAFAAVALLNVVMERTPSRPWIEDGPVDAAPIREAMLACYDSQIDGMEPQGTFKVDQRAALVAALDEFERRLAAE